MTSKNKRTSGTPEKSKRNKQICMMRQDGYTCREIGEKFGISRARVSSIIAAHSSKYCPASPEDLPKDLIPFSQCAKIAGVAGSTITSWSTRFADFPKRYNPLPGQFSTPTSKAGGRPPKGVSESEFRAWLKMHKKRSRPQAGVSKASYKSSLNKRKMKVIIHSTPEVNVTLGGRFKRFLGINS